MRWKNIIINLSSNDSLWLPHCFCIFLSGYIDYVISVCGNLREFYVKDLYLYNEI